MADNLIRSETLAEIAEAIRIKTDADNAMTAGQMASRIRQIGIGDIPALHHSEALDVLEQIRQIQESGSNLLVFGAIADSHVNMGDEYEALTRTSIRHGAFALETVGSWAGCDFLVNLGDNCWNGKIDTAEDAAAARYLRGRIAAAFGRTGGYHLVGDYDRAADPEDVYALIGAHNSFDVSAATASRGYGYTDHPEKKVRVIVLNTSDCASGGCGMSYEQKDFLIRALDLSGKSDAAQWQILLLSHFPLDYSENVSYNTCNDVNAILKAYKNGTNVLLTVNSAYAAAEHENPSAYGTYDNGYLYYNYRGKNSARIIADFHGHVHNTCYGSMAGCGVLRIATPNTCFYLENRSSSGLYGTSVFYPKTENTAEDTAVTFYAVDLDACVVYSIAYGAGVNRVIAYT